MCRNKHCLIESLRAADGRGHQGADTRPLPRREVCLVVRQSRIVLQMDEETKALTPVDYLGVKCVSFGFAGQGSAIMRGPMVSGLIQQLVLSAEWGDLDYLVVDFPPGTGARLVTLSLYGKGLIRSTHL